MADEAVDPEQVIAVLASTPQGEEKKLAATPAPFLANILAHPEEVVRLVKGVGEALADSFVKVQDADNRHVRKLAYLIAGVLALIIVSAAVLTATGKLDAVSFGFLAGTIVGGLITYLMQSLTPSGLLD